MAKVTKKQTVKTQTGEILETFFGVENSDYIDIKNTGKNLTETLGGLSFSFDKEHNVLNITLAESEQHIEK